MEKKILYRNDKESASSILNDVATGSVYWSMEGKNLQFTWFDVPAKTAFKDHSHESEQVTYVLEGELFFESGNTVYKLSKGDCILIPGNIDHRVWTENIAAKAVDAWSPVNKIYISQ
jgi:quercetin dioxygenase-like cupin family protein